MTPEKKKRLKYIEYYSTKLHCCKDGEWYDKYALRELQEGAFKPPRVYDVCFCIKGFGLNAFHDERKT